MVDYVVSQGKTVALEPASADLDLFFKPHPVTGDIIVKKDTDAVRRAVKNIILTNKYERPFKPNLGGALGDSLFELNTSYERKRVVRRLAGQLEALEPRVENVKVKFLNTRDSDPNRLNIQISYAVKNGQRINTVDFTVTRVR